MKKFILILLCTFFVAQMATAQVSTTSGFSGFRRGLATIMFAGLGGAVLGLSTLSFYGEPQDHINNIWTGLAIGVVGGSIYVLTPDSKNSAMALDPVPKAPHGVQKISQFQMKWEF